MLQTLKTKIKSNPLLWKILKPVAQIRAKILLNKQPRLCWDSIVAGELVLKVKNIPGTFRSSATSDIARRIVRDGTYEPEVTELLSKYSATEGAIIVVGANIGLLATYIAHTYCSATEVIAIEPNPEAYKHLVHNFAENGISHKAKALNICVGEKSSSVSFSYIKGKAEYSAIGDIIHPAVAGSEITTVALSQQSLDGILGDMIVGLVLVDVEGAEEQVFRGAKDMLQRHHPILVFECSNILLKKFGTSSRNIAKYLSSIGYLVSPLEDRSATIPDNFEGEAIALYNSNLNIIKNGLKN